MVSSHNPEAIIGIINNSIIISHHRLLPNFSHSLSDSEMYLLMSKGSFLDTVRFISNSFAAFIGAKAADFKVLV